MSLRMRGDREAVLEDVAKPTPEEPDVCPCSGRQDEWSAVNQEHRQGRAGGTCLTFNPRFMFSCPPPVHLYSGGF